MRLFYSGVVAGIGGGMMIGWGLGAYGVVPPEGWMQWAFNFAAVALIIMGSAAAGRGQPGPPPAPRNS